MNDPTSLPPIEAEAVEAQAAYQRPTHTRWAVLSMSIVMAVLLYLDRFSLNVVQPIVMEEVGISLTAMGWITAAFFYAYALSQVPAGAIGDYFGGRTTLAIFVATWSVVFGLQALAITWWMFLILRALQGVAQAGAYAVTAGFLKNWIEPQRRGFANSAVSMGGRAGGLLSNLVTPQVMMLLVPAMAAIGYASSYEPGRWRETFLIYAALGLVWSWVFWRWFRNTPAEHAGVNAAELVNITGLKAVKVETTPVPPFYVILGNRNVWLLSFIMLFVNVGWIFLTTSQTTYLNQVFGWSVMKAGSYAAFTSLLGMAGCLCGGFATDFLMGRIGERWGRCLPGIVSAGGAALMYLIAMTLKTPEYVVLAFACVYFLNDFMLGSLWSTLQDVGGRNSGAMFGFVNMSGNLGAAMFPPVIGMLVKAGSWNSVFLVSAGAFLISLTLWFFVDPRIKITQPARGEV